MEKSISSLTREWDHVVPACDDAFTGHTRNLTTSEHWTERMHPSAESFACGRSSSERVGGVGNLRCFENWLRLVSLIVYVHLFLVRKKIPGLE